MFKWMYKKIITILRKVFLLNWPYESTNSYTTAQTQLKLLFLLWEHSGPVVECLTRAQGAAGLSLLGITALCP